MLESIPANRREAVRLAITTTFGSTPLSAFQRITSGASALIYRFDVGGHPYLLRVESSLRDEVRDPERALICMRAAAGAGIAPRLLYADPAAEVAIMDFVPGCPLDRFPGGPEARARELGTLLRRLQELPPFPAVARYPDILERMFDRLIETGHFADGLLRPHREGFKRIREAYQWDDHAMVASHNDPHPDNIIFDGGRLWLIDWETAYRNDPVVDAAIMTLYMASSRDVEEALIRSWLGRSSNSLLRARLVLMRQLVKLFYGLANGLYGAAAHPGLIETDLWGPTPAEFRAAIDDGRLVANSPEAQRIGGKVAFRSFIDGLSTKACNEALAVASRG